MRRAAASRGVLTARGFRPINSAINNTHATEPRARHVQRAGETMSRRVILAQGVPRFGAKGARRRAWSGAGEPSGSSAL